MKKLNSRNTQPVSISIDDGHPMDLKAAEILAAKNIKTTFYIPIKNSNGSPTLNSKQIKWLSQQPNFEIGGHTYNHINLTKVSLQKAKEEMRTGKEALEDIIGKKITTFAWPWGDYNNSLIRIAQEVGFTSCRSAVTLNFNPIDKTRILWHPNLCIYPHASHRGIVHSLIRLDYYSLFMRAKYMNKNYLELIQAFKDINKPYHIWFHSWEIEKLSLWGIIKDL